MGSSFQQSVAKGVSEAFLTNGSDNMNKRTGPNSTVAKYAALESWVGESKDQEAIRSLLDFQQQKVHNSDKTLKKPSKTSAADEKPENHFSPMSETKKATLLDLLSAQEKFLPPPRKQIIPQIFLVDVGKKRKHHATVEGQFENAIEQLQLPRASPPKTPPSSLSNPVGSDWNVYARPPFNAPSKPAIAEGPVPLQIQLRVLNQQSRDRRMHLESLPKARPSPAIKTSITKIANAASVQDYDDSGLSQLANHTSGDPMPEKNGTIPVPNGTVGAAANLHSSIANGAHETAKDSYQNPPNDLGSMLPVAPSRLMDKATSTTIFAPGLAAHVQYPEVTATSESIKHTNGFPPNNDMLTRAIANDAEQESRDPCIPRYNVQVPFMKPPPTSHTIAPPTAYRYEQDEAPAFWGKIARAPRIPGTQPDDNQEHPIVDLNENDVLLGRYPANISTGTFKFYEFISKYRMAYATAATKGFKRALARYLCNIVRANHGRFLRRDKSEGSSWYEAGDKKAVMKCIQILRDRMHDSDSSQSEHSLSSSNCANRKESPAPSLSQPSLQVAARKRPPMPVGGYMRQLPTKFRYESHEPPAHWGELATVPRIPKTLPDEEQNHPIADIKENDVLLGRGGHTFSNPGNIKFRDLVSKYRMVYAAAPKVSKGALARYLCNFIRANQGRFLSRDRNHKWGSGDWYEVGDEKAVAKCAQALREVNQKHTVGGLQENSSHSE